jgi:hypothetical protein
MERNNMKQALIVIGIVAFLGLAVWYEVEMWSECRQTNSFWYCMRVLSK